MITFVGMSSRSSGNVRGLQVAQALGGNFFDTDRMRFVGSPAKFHPTVIFVRTFHPNIADHLVKLDHKIGFDVIDRAVASLHRQQKSNSDLTEIDWSEFHDERINFYILGTTSAKIQLSPHLSKDQQIFIIPHHAAPPAPVLKSSSDSVKTVGYIGTSDQLMYQDEIRKFCKERGAELITSHPNTREEVINLLSKIDVGIAFVERNNRTGYVIDYKPNTKLSNFQCFGIPSVVTEYDSFVEFGDNCYLPGNSKEEFFQNLERLFNEKTLRESLSSRGLTVGKDLVLSKVKDYYLSMIELL